MPLLTRIAAQALMGLGIALTTLTGVVPAAIAASPEPTPTNIVAPDSSESDEPVSWSVEPADETGQADGRSWIELTLDPGDTVTERMLVTNRSDRDVQFALTAADGYFTDTGRFNMLPANQTSTDAGTWITLDPTITLPAGRSAVIPFTVTVPTNATPGDHPAGVTAGILTSTTDGTVGVSSRIGFRVMTRVAGALTPQTTVAINADYQPSWNPFLPGAVTITTDVSNTGNVRLGAATTLTIAGPFGLFPTTLTTTPVDEFAPGETRHDTATATSIWPLFATTITATTTATPVTDDAIGTIPTATATTTIGTVPLSQLLTVIALAALVVLIIRDHRRRAERWQDELERAREQGRTEHHP